MNKLTGLRSRTAYQAIGTAVLVSCMLILPGLSVLAVEDLPQKGVQERYGEKKKIATAGGARTALRKHFSKKNVLIGDIVEKDLYFEAEIMDAENRSVIDRVIVDKRTGRIRSIY